METHPDLTALSKHAKNLIYDLQLLQIDRRHLEDTCLYRGVLVLCEYGLKRVIATLDILPCFIVDQLLTIRFHKGTVGLLWKDGVPQGYEEGECLGAADGDSWYIYESDCTLGLRYTYDHFQ